MPCPWEQNTCPSQLMGLTNVKNLSHQIHTLTQQRKKMGRTLNFSTSILRSPWHDVPTEHGGVKACQEAGTEGRLGGNCKLPKACRKTFCGGGRSDNTWAQA